MTDKKKLLVTGASGLIGSHLVPELLQDYNLTTLGRRNTHQGCDHITADFSNPLNLPVAKEKLEGIIHLSQSEHYRHFPEMAKEIFDVNICSTMSLLEYARLSGASFFVFASSGGVYGAGAAGGHCDEEAVIEAAGDLDFYSSTKIINEILASNYQKFFRIIILRFFFVYGKGQNEMMLVPRLRKMIRELQPINVSGPHGLLINPIHVSDAVKSVKASLDLKTHHKINIAGPEIIGLKEICEVLGRQVGYAPKLVSTEGSEQESLVGDTSLMCQILIEPSIRFEDGIYIK